MMIEFKQALQCIAQATKQQESSTDTPEVPANRVSFLGKNSEKGIQDCLLKFENGVADRKIFPKRVWFWSNFCLEWFGFTKISGRNSGNGTISGIQKFRNGYKKYFWQAHPRTYLKQLHPSGRYVEGQKKNTSPELGTRIPKN